MCLLFIKSRALQDLGIFAAVSVFGAAFFALLLIPHLYKPGNVKEGKSNFIDTIAKFEFSKNKVLLISCLLLFVVSIFNSFDTVNTLCVRRPLFILSFGRMAGIERVNVINLSHFLFCFAPISF